MSSKTPKPTTPCPPTPAEALKTTFEAFLAAAVSFAEEAPIVVHQTDVGDYRLAYVAGEIRSVTRR